MAEQIELMMRQVKLGGMAKGWRSVRYENTEQYVTELLKLELQEREANRINRTPAGNSLAVTVSPCRRVNSATPERRVISPNRPSTVRSLRITVKPKAVLDDGLLPLTVLLTLRFPRGMLFMFVNAAVAVPSAGIRPLAPVARVV